MNEPVLEVRHLSVQFGKKKRALTAVEDVSFTLKKGETLGIVGESGCGKSVTATSIMRLLPKGTGCIAGGEILLDGQDLVKLSNREMAAVRGGKISMIFQDPMTSLNPVYSIGNQLIEMLKAHTNMPKKEAYEKSVEMLRKVGIPAPEQRMKAYPHELSGGMRQRVMIAMALSTEPEILIADEPTTALDVTIQAQILELMAELKEGSDMSIILITHDLGVVSDFADRTLIMYAGEVVEYSDVYTIFTNPLHPYTRGLLKSIPRADRKEQELFSIEGTVPSLDEMPSGCHFSTRCPHCTDRCRREKPPLFDVGEHQVRCWNVEEEVAAHGN